MALRAQIMALTIGSVALTAAPALADTVVVTKWKLTGQAQPDCLNQASNAIYAAGFKQGPVGTQSMSGNKDEYVALIRCVSEQNIVFFVMAGPSAGTASQYLDALYNRF